MPTIATCFLTIFQEKIKKLCYKLKEWYQKPFRLGQKTKGFEKKKLKDLKNKTQGNDALLGLLGLQKVHKKQACSKHLSFQLLKCTRYGWFRIFTSSVCMYVKLFSESDVIERCRSLPERTPDVRRVMLEVWRRMDIHRQRVKMLIHQLLLADSTTRVDKRFLFKRRWNSRLLPTNRCNL